MNDYLHRVIGIDLGTTYSAVATFSSFDESPEIICDPTEGKPRGMVTPSVVWLTPQRQAAVGDEAKRAIAGDPASTVSEIKREMGEKFTDELLGKYLARDLFRVGDAVKVFFGGEWLLPQEVSALILMRMKQIAEAELGGEIHDAVVTVPAHFTEPRKAATREAALLAGLYPRQLIPEPTAAAYCYGVDVAEPERKVYLVYDLGGGTFDVSIIAAEERTIDVIATSGDQRLGGGDFDDAIISWLLARAGLDASEHPMLARRIKPSAEAAKRDLSLREETEILLPPVQELQGLPAQIPLDLGTFESLIENLLRKSLRIVEDAISQAQEVGVTRDGIDAVLLVGGSTRIPMVRRMLREHFDRGDNFVRADADPDTLVARGAAMVARTFDPTASFVMASPPEATLVSRDADDQVVINLITEHTLGVGVQDNRVDALIRRGSTIPCKTVKSDYINPANAVDLVCAVYQGEGKYAFDNELVGTVQLGPLEPREEGYYKFEVTFALDVNGLLDVRVKNLKTGQDHQAKFEQNTRIGENEKLDARRSWLAALYDSERLGRPAQPGAKPEPGPGPIPPPVAVPPASAAGPAGPGLVEIHASVPEEFRATVRRVQRFLEKQPDAELAAAFNALAAALNSAASADDLRELGDELADVFDDVRLHLR